MSLIRCVSALAACSVSLGVSLPAAAQVTNFTDLLVRSENSSFFTAGSAFSSSQPVSLQRQGSYTGLDGSGNTQTMTYNASSFADARDGLLRASSSLDLGNVFFNSNNPEMTSAFSGVASTITLRTQARFLDSIAIDSADSVSTLRFSMLVEGNLSSSLERPPAGGFRTFISSSATFRGGSSTSNFTTVENYRITSLGFGDTATATFSEIVTFDVDVFNNTAGLAIQLQTQNGLIFSSSSGNLQIVEGADYASLADFGNSASILGVEGFNADGTSADILGVTGTSGLTYTIIPAPGTAMLIACGGVLGIRRRRA